MVKIEHTRVAIAMVAAVALHALLLTSFDQPSRSLSADTYSGDMRISLIKEKVRVVAPAMPAHYTEPPSVSREELKQDTPLPRAVKNRQVQAVDRSIAYTAPKEPKEEFISVPVEVQKLILTNIIYPRSARRAGWQGEAELLFNISGHAVQKVVLQTSSGYPALDRAARRGLLSVNNLPLTDGSYRLPVVFKLL